MTKDCISTFANKTNTFTKLGVPPIMPSFPENQPEKLPVKSLGFLVDVFVQCS